MKVLPDDTYIDVLGMDAKLIRLAAPELAASLTYLFTLSLEGGFVPLEWKTARISPVYKGAGSKTDKSNYCPISVVGHVAKIF